MATLDEMKAMVGTVIGTSEWVLVDQEMINKFADATGDHQFIHVNPEMAKMTPFGQTIAHGFLTLSLMPVLSAKANLPHPDGIKMGVNYGCDICVSSAQSNQASVFALFLSLQHLMKNVPAKSSKCRK